MVRQAMAGKRPKIRDDLIRVISVRDMNRRERKEYDHAQEESSEDSEVSLGG